MYSEPTINIGSRIFGIHADSRLQNAVHSSITAENPAQIPILNGSAPRKPLREPFDIDKILFGPGVTAVTIAYVKNENQLNMLTFPPA